MQSRKLGLTVASLSLASLSALLLLAGCNNNTFNPLCGSARPAPLIGSLSPSTVSFSQVQAGTELTVNGSQFVSASEVLIDSKPLSATVVSAQQLKVKLTTGVISGPGSVNVMVETPSGNTGDLGCTSGGKSSVLVLTID
jgi:ABC-type phosphate transport system substrate-binding protein